MVGNERGNFVKRKRGLRTYRVLACLVNPRKTEGRKLAELLLLAWFSRPITDRQFFLRAGTSKERRGKKFHRKEVGGGCGTPRHLQHLPSHGGQKYRSNAGSSISRMFRLGLRSKILLRPEGGQTNENKRLQSNSPLPLGCARRLCASAADFGLSTHACACAIHSARDEEPE